MVSAVTLGKVVIETADSNRDESEQRRESGRYLGQPPARRQIVLPAAMAYVVGGALWIGLGIALYALYVHVASSLHPLSVEPVHVTLPPAGKHVTAGYASR